MSVSSKNGKYPPHERGRSASPFAVVASAEFESGPPASKIRPLDEDADVIETVKEEEWEERRKKTTTKTRNVERRVQRQLVLEDGEVVGDSGPVVTEDATEDVVTKEDVSDQNLRPEGQLAIEPPPGEGWVATPGAVVISEKCTKTTKSHDEVEDELETEEITHCGDVTNKEAEEHLRGDSDLRELTAQRQSRGWELAKPQKRVVHEASRRKGHIDTVDVRETSKVQDGHVVTETERTVRQEQYDNESLPDSGSSLSDGSVHEKTKETSHNLVHTKDEDLLEYYAVPKGGTLAQGVKIGEGMHVVSEDVHEDRQGDEDDSPSGGVAIDRLRKARATRPSRRDALTKRPLDYDQEEETRKSETTKWLEHHFGSDSGRSEGSTHDAEDVTDSRIHSAGGNRITITMSPRPTTGDDPPKAPPPPPPKPERLWNAPLERQTSPQGSVPPPVSRHAHDIQGSELAAARSRLRSTGLSLTDEDKENNAPETPYSGGRLYTTDSGVQSTTVKSSLKDDVIYSSRFRSGKPKSKAPLAPDYTQSPGLQVPLSSPPPSITNVGRSQSFHVQTIPWSSTKREAPSPFKSSLKDYRSEERLDNIDSRRGHSSQYHNQQHSSRNYTQKEYAPVYSEKTHSWQLRPTSWSPPREPTPPPPPRQSRRGKSTSAPVEAATQTGPSPVPPPRTKRKKRPKSSYFFGDSAPSSRYVPPNTHYIGNSENRAERTFSSSSSSRRSPKVEKRYKTTKTITPVIVVPFESNARQSDRYQTSDFTLKSTNRASWTNTVDPRRRPRVTTDEERCTTLPRKLSGHGSSGGSSFPKKTYLFGERDPVSSNASPYNTSRNMESYQREPHRGSMHNISTQQTESSYSDYSNRYTSLNNRLNSHRTGSNKPVGRSQSFNVQAAKEGDYVNAPIVNGRHLSEIPADHRTSTVYGSSPYVNHLRSPNLIATIARSSSTRRSDYNESSPYENTPSQLPDQSLPTCEEKRERFMKGLLNTAPELFHFIHGGDNETATDTNATTAPNQTSSPISSPSHTNSNRPTVDIPAHSPSSYAPPTNSKSPTYSARVFTFGKSDHNTLTRAASTPQGVTYDDENRRNYFNSIGNNNNNNSTTIENNKNSSLINSNNNKNINSNRRSTFNLKASGSSLLYSPSFRSQQQQREAEERRSRESSLVKERLSGDFGGTSGMQGGTGGSPVIVQVRDWNMR